MKQATSHADILTSPTDARINWAYFFQDPVFGQQEKVTKSAS